jgi:uncharacterized protein
MSVQTAAEGLRLVPFRPATERRPGVGLGKQPASTKRVHMRWTREEVTEFVRGVRDIPPENR